MSTFQEASQSHLINMTVQRKVTHVPLSVFRQEDGPLTLGLLHWIFKHVAEAMAFAHDKEMSIGNISEENIVVELNQQVCCIVLTLRAELLGFMHAVLF